MRKLFSGGGKDACFLAIRDQNRWSAIRTECERLWDYYRELAPQGFIDHFSQNFRGHFWEMYLGALLRTHHPNLKVPKDGPDFSIPSGDSPIFVEATSVSRGNTKDAVPDISTRSDDDDTVPFRELALRITASLKEKSEANRAKHFAKEGAYVVAVNLPFREAWLCGTPPLSAQAALGLGGQSFVRQDGEMKSFVSYIPSIQKKETPAEVATTAFRSSQYTHVSALLIALVNPFSSCYDHPAMELLHNPNAAIPLPLGWLPVGCEYWVINKFKSKNHGAPRRPWTAGSR